MINLYLILTYIENKLYIYKIHTTCNALQAVQQRACLTFNKHSRCRNDAQNTTGCHSNDKKSFEIKTVYTGKRQSET